MTQQFSYRQPKQDKAMTNEQFQQIVEAILNGKYSWACVLILRFAGYNPLHYIPYRTYNRLIKDNCNCVGGKTHQAQLNSNPEPEIDSRSLNRSLFPKESTQIKDISHLEDVDPQDKKIFGGFRLHWFFW